MAQELPTALSATLPFRFRVSEDGMRAYLDLMGPPPNPIPGLEEFAEAWQAQGLDPAQMNPEKVLEAADAWKKTGASQRDVLIAESNRLPKHGKDGRLEFFIPITSAAGESGAEKNGAKVDLRSVRAIRAVSKGQPLVRRHPPEKGEPGLDLMGRAVPASDGKDYPLPGGDLIALDPKDPQTVVAGASGYVEWEKGRLVVRECFVVSGAVDYATGNIDYERNVLVKGDVQDGFSVRAGGDLQVEGSVGDAQITVVGKVIIQGGFLGKGQGILNTMGEVQVGFVSNQTLRAYKAVTVAKESFNARLCTKDTLIVNGPLVGGMAVAGLRMQCKMLGNDLGTRTDVELGVDYLDAEHRAELDRKIRELTEGLQKMKGRMTRIKDAFQKTRKLPPAEAKLLLELRNKTAAIEAALPGLEARKTELVERIRAGYLRKGIELKVEGRLFPGVIIKVENQNLRIPEEVAGPRLFTYFDNRIHMY